MVTTTRFNSDGTSIPAEMHTGTGGAGRGFVVIAYGVDGFVDNQNGPWATMIRGYAEALADAGFIAIIPDYFVKTGTRPGALALDTIGLHRDEWCEAISDAVSYAGSQPSVDPTRTGLLGFSLGGNLCLQLRQKAKVLVEYFAPQSFLGGPSASANLRAQIHHGRADLLVPFDVNAPHIGTRLRGEGAHVELLAYPGANHGFVGEDADNRTAREESLQRTVEFFEQNL